MAAGTDKGDIYIWHIDFLALKKQQSAKASIYLGSFKRHMKTVHFCEFSPDGSYLFTGSVDGAAKIWDIENQTIDGFALDDENLAIVFEEKRIPSKEEQHIFFKDVSTKSKPYRTSVTL